MAVAVKSRISRMAKPTEPVAKKNTNRNRNFQHLARLARCCGRGLSYAFAALWRRYERVNDALLEVMKFMLNKTAVHKKRIAVFLLTLLNKISIFVSAHQLSKNQKQ